MWNQPTESHNKIPRQKKNLSDATLMQNFNWSCLTSYLPRAALLQKKCKKLQTCTIFCCWTPTIDFQYLQTESSIPVYLQVCITTTCLNPLPSSTSYLSLMPSIQLLIPSGFFDPTNDSFQPNRLGFWKPNPPKKIRKKNTIASSHGRVTLEIKLKRIIWVFPKIVVPPNHPF